MQDDEVADVFERPLHLPVVFVALHRIEPAIWEQAEKPGNSGLDEVNGRRFQGLDEAARKTERNDIAIPRELAPPSAERQMPRLRKWLALEVGKEQLACRIV